MFYFLPYCCVHKKELLVSPQSTVPCVAAFSTINTTCWITGIRTEEFQCSYLFSLQAAHSACNLE